MSNDPRASEAPGDSFRPDEEVSSADSETGGESREELLHSVLESTRHSLEDKGLFAEMVKHVRDQRLPSRFSFENLGELVRFIIGRTSLAERLPEPEDCVEWITNCIFEEPSSQSRAENLWMSIVNQIQDEQ